MALDISQLDTHTHTLLAYIYSNAGAGCIASTNKTSSLTRHIAIRHFVCRGLVRSGDVAYGHVPGTNNIADMNTNKALEHIKQWGYVAIVIAKPALKMSEATERAE